MQGKSGGKIYVFFQKISLTSRVVSNVTPETAFSKGVGISDTL